MSSRFVSAGTAEDPPERDDEWKRAEIGIEEQRQQKLNERSLYETLQANKGEWSHPL
jgi:hypothetical protein